jgi:hypothetical protein
VPFDQATEPKKQKAPKPQKKSPEKIARANKIK